MAPTDILWSTNVQGDSWVVPIKGPSSAFAILYAIAGIWQTYQLFKYRALYCLWTIPCACIILVAGCIVREYSAFHPDPTNVSAVEGLFYAGAVVLAASLFMILILTLHLSPKVLTLWRPVYWFIMSLFFSAIISLTSQGAATYFNPNAASGSVSSGRILLEVALCLMDFLAVLFLGLVTTFHRRATSTTPSVLDGSQAKNINIVLWTLYATGLLMLVRDIYRTAQIFSSTDSQVWTSEALFWIFDASVLLAILMVLNVAKPLKYLQEAKWS